MALITCEKAAFAYEGRVVVDALDLTVERASTCASWGKTGRARARWSRGCWG